MIVKGRLTQRFYTDNQGQQRTSLDLAAKEVGPSLRFATAQVHRGQARGRWAASAASLQDSRVGGSPRRRRAHSPPADNPWAGEQQAFGRGFDDEQPF